MAVSISVPLAADDENLEYPFIAEQISTSDFAEESKRILNRVYNQVLADNTTLSNGRIVDSSSLLLEWICEQVAANE